MRHAFEKTPLLGILRGIAEKDVEPLIETSCAAGLQAIEITMNTPGAAALIRKAVVRARSRIAVGAGTVLDVVDLKVAVNSGASFIVSPVFVEDVVSRCVKKKIPVFPGAATPSEIHRAWQAGATMVKVFPVGNLGGPDFIREIKGPLSEVRLLACGGVTAKNAKAYLRAGSSALAFGSGVFKREWIERGRFNLIKREIGGFIRSMENNF